MLAVMINAVFSFETLVYTCKFTGHYRPQYQYRNICRLLPVCAYMYACVCMYVCVHVCSYWLVVGGYALFIELSVTRSS